MVLLGLSVSLSVWGDPTTLAISNAKVAVTSSSSTTLDFPISRGGDTSYDAFIQYQTKNGTAIAGTDYTAANGSLVIPAGTTSTTIPVTVAGRSGNPPDKTFQMLLLGGGGAARSFTPSFAAQQAFATGIGGRFSYAGSVTAADVNGDGKPDLIVVNNGNDEGKTVSVLLNTTAPGAATPSFAAPQTFATGSGPRSVTVADVNGDGKPDLIVANSNDNTVSVLLNTTAPGATTLSFAV
jgi:trimeric autotransporter adhesin